MTKTIEQKIAENFEKLFCSLTKIGVNSDNIQEFIIANKVGGSFKNDKLFGKGFFYKNKPLFIIIRNSDKSPRWQVATINANNEQDINKLIIKIKKSVTVFGLLSNNQLDFVFRISSTNLIKEIERQKTSRRIPSKYLTISIGEKFIKDKSKVVWRKK
jgi:hypothetical protein